MSSLLSVAPGGPFAPPVAVLLPLARRAVACGAVPFVPVGLAGPGVPPAVVLSFPSFAAGRRAALGVSPSIAAPLGPSSWLLPCRGPALAFCFGPAGLAAASSCWFFSCLVFGASAFAAFGLAWVAVPLSRLCRGSVG